MYYGEDKIELTMAFMDDSGLSSPILQLNELEKSIKNNLDFPIAVQSGPQRCKTL